MIKDVLYNTLLFDFYSELLTAKQRDFFEMYYLNEIANQNNITPQAVSDLIKRTEKLLANYEQKLLLLYKYEQQQASLKLLKKYMDILTITEYEKKQILSFIKL
jgi:uncharacterized protein